MVEITNAKTREEKINVLVAVGFSLAQAEIILNGGTPLIGDVVIVGEDGEEFRSDSYVVDLDEP